MRNIVEIGHTTDTGREAHTAW